MKAVQNEARFAVSLPVRLFYGCGRRVTEPLNLRINDVNFESRQLTIRAAKGGKDRIVAVPCSANEDLRQQIESARIIWKQDHLAQIPVVLPGRLASQRAVCLEMGMGFPSNEAGLHPRTGKLVRWRLHEANIQRAVRSACRKTGLSILPHELRHAYATHCLNRGANPRAIQEAMGHKSLETIVGAQGCGIGCGIHFTPESRKRIEDDSVHLR